GSGKEDDLGKGAGANGARQPGPGVLVPVHGGDRHRRKVASGTKNGSCQNDVTWRETTSYVDNSPRGTAEMTSTKRVSAHGEICCVSTDSLTVDNLLESNEME